MYMDVIFGCTQQPRATQCNNTLMVRHIETVTHQEVQTLQGHKVEAIAARSKLFLSVETWVQLWLCMPLRKGMRTDNT